MATSLFKLFGIKQVVAWVEDTATTLAAAYTSGGANMTLAAGGGARFASANVQQPHKIYVGTEILYVTGPAVADVIPVTGAKDSTTASGHAISDPVRHLNPIRLYKSNAFTMNANIQTLEFPGDGDVERVYQSNGIDGTIGISKFGTDLLEYLAGADPITTGLPSDVAVRYLAEQGDYPQVQLDVDLKAVDDIAKAQATLRVCVFLAQLQDPFIIGNAGNNTPQLTEFNWSALGTQFDIFGRPLSGATEDVRYAYDVLS